MSGAPASSRPSPGGPPRQDDGARSKARILSSLPCRIDLDLDRRRAHPAGASWVPGRRDRGRISRSWQAVPRQDPRLRPARHHPVGRPGLVTVATTPRAPDIVFQLGVPVLAICYGMADDVRPARGRVTLSDHQEFGAPLSTCSRVSLFDGLWPQRPKGARASRCG